MPQETEYQKAAAAEAGEAAPPQEARLADTPEALAQMLEDVRAAGELRRPWPRR